ncbi:MAG: SLC13 family permease [Planctomycetaceae bacterium]
MDLSPEACSLAVILAVVVVAWVTEILPLPVTALAGAAACVLAGVAPMREVFRPFADPLIFLFIGSFMLAEAIRVHRLDRRLAFAVLALPAVGEHPGRVLAAVAAVSATISAFISNTATTAMMTTIAVGILAAVEDAGSAAGDGASRRPDRTWATGLLLAVAFGASIGGLATPIGTPPNVIGLGLIRKELGVEVPFLRWCAIGVPVAVILTALAVALLGRLFPAGVDRLDGVAALVARERATMGRWTAGQASTALAFAVTVSLWVLPGVLGLVLGEAHPLPALLAARVPEGVAALVGAILLFVLPGGPGRKALSWREAAAIDWGIILLYGGGMALGELSFSTGLAEAIGRGLTGFLPPGAGVAGLVAAAAVVAALTSEFTSNTASANMVVPVAISLAQAAGEDALPVALAATFAASLGFMMPVSTPCNSIVYGTGRIRLRDMIRAGLFLDVAGTVIIAAVIIAAAMIAAG